MRRRSKNFSVLIECDACLRISSSVLSRIEGVNVCFDSCRRKGKNRAPFKFAPNERRSIQITRFVCDQSAPRRSRTERWVRAKGIQRLELLLGERGRNANDERRQG